MTGAASFTKPAMIVALDANGEVVSETNLPEQIELRTGTASPTVQIVCELHAAAPLFHRQTGLQRL